MQLSNPELALLSKTEISQIFSKIPALIEVHEKIHNDLRTYVMHWANDRLIGKVSFLNSSLFYIQLYFEISAIFFHLLMVIFLLKLQFE